MKTSEKIAYHILRSNQSEKKKYAITLFHKTFIVYPGVFSPKYFNDTELFAKYLPIKRSSTVLEIGTGAGIIPIVAILRGAKRFVGTDINPLAVKNARANVRFHKLNKKIKIIKSDLFAQVSHQQFDLIFFNIPFCFTTKRRLSLLEKALFDYKYTTVTRCQEPPVRDWWHGLALESEQCCLSSSPFSL